VPENRAYPVQSRTNLNSGNEVKSKLMHDDQMDLHKNLMDHDIVRFILKFNQLAASHPDHPFDMAAQEINQKSKCLPLILLEAVKEDRDTSPQN
jgi:hypothetical protein